MPILIPILRLKQTINIALANILGRLVLPEVAIHMAIKDPKNQHQTAVAGPPELMGTANVAGTEPNTPRIEIA